MFAGKDAGQDGGEAGGPGAGQPTHPVCSRPQRCRKVKHPWTGLCPCHYTYHGLSKILLLRIIVLS